MFISSADSTLTASLKTDGNYTIKASKHYIVPLRYNIMSSFLFKDMTQDQIDRLKASRSRAYKIKEERAWQALDDEDASSIPG